MKVHKPSITGSFIGYLGWIQDSLGRKLNEKEIKECLQRYITGCKVNETLEEFRNE